jgi:hypothetical protein
MGVLSFGMIILPFVDNGDVSGYFLLVGGLILVSIIIFFKFILAVFQIINNRKGKSKVELTLAILQLILSMPIIIIIFYNYESIKVFLNITKSPFFFFPIIDEIIILFILVMDYFSSEYKLSKKFSLINIIAPGIGTLLVGNSKHNTLIGYIQLILFVIFIPFGLNNKIKRSKSA